jgi:hypothetical protein
MPQSSAESTIRRGFVLQPTYRIERNPNLALVRPEMIACEQSVDGLSA